MHRFVVKETLNDGQRITLSKEESHHAAKVLRLQPGDRVQLLDGSQLWQAVLITVDEVGTIAETVERLEDSEPPCRAVLWQGLPKAEKMEWIVQKATELGISEIIPIEMERSVAQIVPQKEEKKRERLSRIALEAAKQSGRAKVPEVCASVTLEQALKQLSLSENDLFLVAWEEEHAARMSQVVTEQVRQYGIPQRVVLVIGPEGGISEQEWLQMKGMGAKAVTLGKRILRTETAGLCALSVLWTVLGEM